MPQDEAEIFQHYRVLRREDGSLWKLGAGAMGVTYKAIDTNLDAPVALKVINALYTGNEAARERFIREARAAASLRHRNVASIFHLGRDAESFFYAMEFIDGETVEHFVQREGPQSWRVALPTVLQVARALMAAHEKRIVHRDIKPANVMLVREAGEDDLMVKVIDFGLAKSLVEQGGSVVNVSGTGFLGTPLYASPEQCEELAPDIRSDIYSLGVTLWFLLAGRPPFEGGLGKVFSQHLHAPPPWAQLSGGVPEPVRALLARMLAKDRADRPQTPAELRQELETCLRVCGSGVTEAPPARLSLEDALRRNDGRLPAALVADLLVPLAKIVDAAGTTPLDLTPGGVWGVAGNSRPTPPRAVPFTDALLTAGMPGWLEVRPLTDAARPPISTGNETIPPSHARFAEPVAALAALAYELLDGAPPGFGRSYRPLSECDEESNALLRRALEDGAFDGAATFAAALGPALRRRPAKSAAAAPLPSPPVKTPPTRPFPAKNIMVVAALAALAVIALFGWWAFAPRAIPIAKSSPAPSPKANPAPPPATAGASSPKEDYEAGINLWNGMEGTLIDQPRAVAYFQAAAAKGYAPAQAILAVVYQEGLGGVQKDVVQAEKWATASLGAGLREEAEEGDAEAQCRLGSLYGEGIGTPKDESKAVELYTKAADQGLASAENNLGNCYFNGIGVEKDLAKATELYAKAANQGLPTAQNILGFCYEHGFGVEKDLDKAIELYRKAANQGSAPGQINLGRCYLYGFGVEKDVAKAAGLYKKAADQGNADGQNALGVCYLNGFGVEKDVAKAIGLYKEAAAQGNAQAESNLGVCYVDGFGVEKDANRAVELYEKAANQGNADGQFYLGDCYIKGIGVEKDPPKAIELYQKAAAQGEAPAEFNLGYCYFNGLAVEKDLGKAVEFYTKAADQGFPPAESDLGFCYFNGFGVEKDLGKAVELYTKAADQGNAAAAFNLGYCYERGAGVEKNFRKAVELYRKSAELGNSNAQNRLRSLRVR